MMSPGFGVSLRLLLVWLLCVCAATLFPYEFQATVSDPWRGLHVLWAGRYQQNAADFGRNVILFVPLGTLLHFHWRCRFRSLAPSLAASVVVGFLISLSIEYGQVFLPSRDPSAVDLFANTAGALTGVALHRTWGARGEAFFAQFNNLSAVTMFRLVLVVSAITLALSALLQRQSRLTNWSADYPLLVGNEHTGDRPWRGRIFALDITDAATPSEAVGRFSVDGSLVLIGARVAGFDFTTGPPPYQDAARILPDLERPDFSLESTAAGDLTELFWLRTDGAASSMVLRLKSANAFTLRVLCVTEATDQVGPARIVSNSLNPGLRNFTIGQQRADMVFRLRTPGTGLNGFPPEIVVPGVFAGTEARDVLMTYDGATLLATVAGSNLVSRVDLTPGSILALAIFRDVRPDELAIYTIAYLAAPFIVPGVLVSLTRNRRRAMLVVCTWLPAFAVVHELVLVLVSGRAFDWANVATTGLVAVAVLCLVGIVCTPSAMPQQRVPGGGYKADSGRQDSVSTPGLPQATRLNSNPNLLRPADPRRASL